MRWINFSSGARYTFAADIQKFAELNGYDVPCESDGTRHPGTDCNVRMRAVIKDAGLRRTFKVTESSVVDVREQDSPSNAAFLRWLVDNKLVNDHYLRKRVIHLYTEEAVNALLSSMLKVHVEYHGDDSDEHWYWCLPITKSPHNLEKRKNKPKVSLFNK